MTALSKGSVESLVKWVKGNFLPGRSFADDADLTTQADGWTTQANTHPSSDTGEPPLARLHLEAAKGGVLPPTAHDYGLLLPGQVSAEALVAVAGNRYSVPVAHVGAPVTVRVHRQRIRIWRDTTLVADHARVPDGAHQRVVDPAHFAPLFPQKPRAQAMLYRDVLLELGEPVSGFLTELSRRQRARLVPELHAVYALYEQVGAPALLAAMAVAVGAGTYSADALALLLQPPPVAAAPAAPLHVPGIPTQAEIDRPLGSYEQWVAIDVAMEEVGA